MSGQNPNVYDEETFRELYCRVHGCSPNTFTRRILLQCAFPHALPIGLLLFWLDAPSVQRAIVTVRQVANARNSDQVKNVVNEYFRYIDENGGLWINLFKIRLSGTRLIRLYRDTCIEAERR